MNTIFFLVKFFREVNHVADFIDGKIFCNTVSTFKKIEGNGDLGRGDKNEWTNVWLQPGSARVEINGIDLTEDLAGPLQVQMNWLDYLHVFCMHAVHTGDLDLANLSNESMEVLRRELMIPDDCLKLGDYAVVVKDVAGFIERMRAGAIAKGYRFARRVVNYYDPETFHGSFGDLNHDIEPVFWKQKRHGYQREFRFVIDSGSLSDCPLVLEIGDLSDITWQLGAVELSGPAFLGGDMAFPERK